MNTIHPKITRYAEVWTRHLAAAAVFNAHVDAIIAEDEAMGSDGAGLLYSRDRVDLADLRKSILEHVQSLAETTFAPTGTRLKLSLEELSRVAGDDFDTFSPVAVWTHLEAKHGGGKAHEEAFRAVATRLASTFRLKPGDEVNTVKGGLSVKKSMYPDSFGPAYSYHSREDARQTLSDLRTFLGWAGLDTDALIAEHDFGHARNTIWEIRAINRDRLTLGEHLTAILFKSCIEFRFSQAASTKFQEFVTQHDRRFAPDLAAAA